MTDTNLPITPATEVSSENSIQTTSKWHMPTFTELDTVLTAAGISYHSDSEYSAPS